MTVTAERTDRFDDLVTMLSQGIGQRALYFESHPRVRQLAWDLVTRLHTLCAGDDREFFFLGFVEGNLVHQGQILVGPTILGRRVIELLKGLDSGGILLKTGLDQREVLELFNITADSREASTDLTAMAAALKQRGIENIQFSPPYRDPGWFGLFLYEGGDPFATVGAPNQQMVQVYQHLFDSVEGVHRLAQTGAGFDVDDVRAVSEELVRSADGSFTDVMQLVRYPDFDTFTVGHSVRVASITVLVANHLGMSPEFQMELATAGLLHDVGKSQIPQEVLFKASALDADERRIMDRHPVLGAQILLDNRDTDPTSLAAAWGHHLRFDGAGYPAMPAWGASSRITALVKVCDVFEALTAVRPYKSAMSARRAFELMLEDRGSFDPGAFAALVQAMGLYPPGTHVLLSTGEVGVVSRAGKRIELPVVRVTHDKSGEPVTGEKIVRDLSASGVNIRVSRALQEQPGDAAEQSDPAHGAMCNHPPTDAEAERIRRHVEPQ